MIIGIGVDIIETARVGKACEKQAFLTRYFTEKEREEIARRPMIAAGDFAAKEAVAKVLGCGFGKVGPEEIEITRDEAGAPHVQLHGNALSRARELRIDRVHVSISNTEENTIAFAVGESECANY